MIDNLNPATWDRAPAITSDGRPILINPANGQYCVMPPAHWPNAHIPRGPNVYEREREQRIKAEAPAMLAALRALVDQCEATSAWDDALAGEDPQMLADVENARAILARIDGEA